MTIVAHNASFDISFVKKMFADNGHELTSNVNADEYSYDKLFSRNAIDTATMALILRLQSKLSFDRCSLDNILKFYELECESPKRHSALFDATQTTIAFLKMFEHLSGKKITNKNDNQIKYDEDFDDLAKK